MAQKALNETWTYIDAMVRSRSSLEVEDILMSFVGRYGLTSAFGGIIPETFSSPEDVVDLVLIQRFPVEWSQRYRVKNYLLRDPILQRLQADSRSTFTWQDAYETGPDRDGAKIVGGEAAEFGLREGIVVPVEMLDRCPVAVSFGGPMLELGDDDLAALRFGTTYAIGQILHHRANEKLSFVDLSIREMDCLRWAAEGKSDWEIGKILGIAAATVEKHNLAVRTKLGAVNRAHAIAKALRLQIIL